MAGGCIHPHLEGRMSTETSTPQRQFTEWLRRLALESRNGVLQASSNQDTWRFFYVNGDIRAVSATPTTLLDSARSEPIPFLTKTLIALGIGATVQSSFSDGREVPPPSALVTRVSSESVLAELARHALDPAAIRERLGPSDTRFIAVRSAGLEKKSTTLSRDEVFLFSRLDVPMRVEDVLSISPFGEVETLRHMYTLYLLGLVDVYSSSGSAPSLSANAPQDTGRAVTMPYSIPPSRDEAMDWLSLKSEIEERSAMISGGDYYDLLNITRKASPDEIKKNYYRLAKRFHPDHYKARAPEAIHEQLVDLFRHLTEAYETLSYPLRRMNYDRRLASPTFRGTASAVATPPLISEKDRAERSFSEGKQLFDKKEYAKALPYFRDAANLQPQVADYISLLASTLAQIPQTRKEAEEYFLKAIELESENPSHYVLLGNFYKDINLPSRARKMFEQALARDASNELVQQELRGIPTKGGAEKSLGSKLKKIFSKK